MLKKVLMSVSVGAVGLSLLLPCQAAAPMKIASVAPVADLVTEAAEKVKVLDENLASAEKYGQGKGTTIPSAAGVLAVLAQAISESEEASAWKATAPDVRDAGIAIATSKSYDDAKKGLEAAKAAIGGKGAGAKAEADWSKLCKLGSLMKEVNIRNGKLRRQSRKITDAEEAARHASVLAILALAAHDDVHEVKDAAKVSEWQAYSKTFSTEMTAAAAAFRKNDKDAAAAAFKKANTACNECHGKFRENE